MDLCNINVIKSVMADAGITFHKEFGQNFLTNRIIPEDIADNCADTTDRMILEIGPGIGCLTQELAMLKGALGIIPTAGAQGSVDAPHASGSRSMGQAQKAAQMANMTDYGARLASRANPDMSK